MWMREAMIDTTDPKPADEIRFLRASVADQCNLNCVYCPKTSGMENQVPAWLARRRLSTADYCRNLGLITASGVIRRSSDSIETSALRAKTRPPTESSRELSLACAAGACNAHATSAA